MTIADNITRIRERIAAACERSGRNPDAVRLIAISKVKPAKTNREFLESMSA